MLLSGLALWESEVDRSADDPKGLRFSNGILWVPTYRELFESCRKYEEDSHLSSEVAKGIKRYVCEVTSKTLCSVPNFYDVFYAT
jgi:hypothetical protein